ncbi:non-oxidative hydroxyarylic acid decarboxylases subunit D [Paraburkholderia fungorum]|uniref:non-oxidative hydroxyarylic acid decarboxylases subunit D n=1 Tax=Paraburkholderia fungorum TaxID=134537 RepID=UPI00161756FA|nr:non-oxidative hydroxyarylic acid decarboxylases subunit D [Paraburkholderia fungorum]MBB5547695.1 C4-type Zn-finger protein [Paraburkholderia fungorum]
MNAIQEMNPPCPRCESQAAALMHQGIDNGERVWSIWHCSRCAFTWRDSEPPESIDLRKRAAWSQLKGVDLTRLRQVILPSDTPK